MIKNGLSERLGEIGKIKIGGKGDTRKSRNGKDFRLPVKYEHFVVTTTERGEDGNFVTDAKIMKLLGDKPKEIPIRLPFDDIDMNFHTSFQHYDGKKLRCKGNGETAESKNDKGEMKTIKCDPESCPRFKAEKCKVSGILSCMIPASMEIGGIYRFRTHGWNSVSNILSALKYFASNTNGILQGLPLKLKMAKKSTEEHGNVTVVTITIDGKELLEMRNLALLEHENRLKLGIDMKAIESSARKSGVMDDKDDPVDVSEEFYNENVEPEPTGITSEQATEKLQEEKDVTPGVEKKKGGGLF